MSPLPADGEHAPVGALRTKVIYVRLHLQNYGDIVFRVTAHATLTPAQMIQNAVEHEGGWLHGQTNPNARWGMEGSWDNGDDKDWTDASINLGHFAVVTPFEPVSGNPT